MAKVEEHGSGYLIIRQRVWIILMWEIIKFPKYLILNLMLNLLTNVNISSP